MFCIPTYLVGFVYQQIPPLLFGWITTTVYFLVFPLLVYLLHFRLIFIGTDYLDMVTNAAICTRLQSTNTEDIVILSCWTHKVLKILAQFVKKTMSRSSRNGIKYILKLKYGCSLLFTPPWSLNLKNGFAQRIKIFSNNISIYVDVGK